MVEKPYRRGRDIGIVLAFCAQAETQSTNAAKGGNDELDEAFDRLQREAPDFLMRAIRWMREPQARSADRSAA